MYLVERVVARFYQGPVAVRKSWLWTKLWFKPMDGLLVLECPSSFFTGLHVCDKDLLCEVIIVMTSVGSGAIGLLLFD